MARRRLRLPTVAIVPFLLACFAPVLAFDPDFGFYPKASQPCMYQAAKTSKCSGDTAPALNTCFCGNGGNFIINTARCLGEKAKKDVQEVYTTMSGACSDSDTPMSVSQSDFFKAANGDLTTTSASSTPTSTPPTSSDPTATPTSTGGADESPKHEGLSTAATIGIAVGVSIAGIAAMAAIAFFLVRRSRQNKADESHPMLAQDYKYPALSTYPPQEPKSSWDQVHITNPYNRDSYLTQATGSPDPRHQSFMTGSHYSTTSEQATQYNGPYAAPARGVAELAPDAAVQQDADRHVFEMDGSNVSSLSQTTQGQRFEPYQAR